MSPPFYPVLPRGKIARGRMRVRRRQGCLVRPRQQANNVRPKHYQAVQGETWEYTPLRRGSSNTGLHSPRGIPRSQMRRYSGRGNRRMPSRPQQLFPTNRKLCQRKDHTIRTRMRQNLRPSKRTTNHTTRETTNHTKHRRPRHRQPNSQDPRRTKQRRHFSKQIPRRPQKRRNRMCTNRNPIQ